MGAWTENWLRQKSGIVIALLGLCPPCATIGAMGNVTRYETAGGQCIYCFQIEAFPTLPANIYVVDDGDQVTLVDCGSGLERSNQDLVAGFEALGEEHGAPISLETVDRIVITHGHVDHFGGLPFVRQFSEAPIGVHILDRRVLSNYEERVVVAARRLETYLERAGVAAKQRQNLMSMYLYAKGVYRSTAVAFLLEEGSMALSGMEIFHVPGHCPGQVCLRLDDMLLTADHVLARTTPHQAPEAITLNMGLGHYLQSLDKIAALKGIALGLGGHEAPIRDLGARIDQIRALHDRRLEQVLEICQVPRSIAEVSHQLFGDVSSYHVLLALEETGAHVEYLYQRGELLAMNLEEIERESNAVIRYERL